MDALARLRAAGKVDEGVAIGPLTTYKFGGPARFLVSVDDVDDVLDAYAVARANGVQAVALGRGSNVVIADGGFEGVVIRAGEGLRTLEVGEMVTAGAAVALPVLAREAARAGRGGLEFYVGIPGSVGGAICMNAGGHGAETRDVLIDATIVDGESGEVAVRTPEDLEMSYRHSNVAADQFVVSARFATVDRERGEAETMIREITRWRREHQPGGTLNAGSAFKNPPGDSAGRIIDAAGLKGMRRGGVRVSERHANFFVAEPGALASDVRDLVTAVAEIVAEQTGIELQPEIRFLGEFG
jgi:UDP-N-acetylmuramate dehydrogenase